MIRSMFTAISSLHLNQVFMDVVADNLANANTYGYKASRFSFQDQYSQLVSIGSAPTNNQGGTNPMQVGLGARLGAISPMFTQGTLQTTGRSTDLAIQGDGFFIYSNGISNVYSRDGMLDMDANGYVVHAPTGMRIQGWQAVGGVVDTGSTMGDIQLPLGSTLSRVTSSATLGGNLDASSTTDYKVTVGVYDSLGAPRNVTLNFARGTDPNAWDVTLDGDTEVIGTVTFNSTGQYVSGSGTVDLPALNGSQALSFDLDLTKLTQLSAPTDVTLFSQDGLAAGNLTSLSVSNDNGGVYGIYSNGMQQLLGQLAFAKFTNPEGLERIGQNMFRPGLNSGDPSVGSANVGGRGTIVSGYLEGSNVNMAQEFTNMIMAQRGFQASSRIITTSDEMLQELVNIKR